MNKTRHHFYGTVVFLALATTMVSAQIRDMPFSRVEIRIDTMVFNSVHHLVTINQEQRLYFEYRSEEQVCEIRLFPDRPGELNELQLLPSRDFELLDSLMIFNDQYIRFRVRFLNLSNSDFLHFAFSYVAPGKDAPVNFTVPLLPFTQTRAELYTDDYQLYIGEEKTYVISSNHVNNIQVNNLWTTGLDINYRLSVENGHLYLHLISTNHGPQIAHINLKTLKPFIDSLGQVQYDLPAITQTFTVKESRLRFLNTDLEEIIRDPANRDGYLMQLDNQPFFSLGRTYRIEDQENPGGPLIAELFTESYLSTGRILCRLRPYALHLKRDGYLYIKDNDVARFILNINIIPKTVVNQVSLLREGGDWSTDLSVNPGETVEVRLEGQSLHVGQFSFEGLNIRYSDTLISNENVAIFHIRIPVRLPLKRIGIFHDQQSTGFALTVKEFQKPRQFDYLYLDINGFKRNLMEVNSVIMVSNVIQDVTISIDPDKIDSEGRLFGKQILDITITIRGKNNEMLELKPIENIQICPGINSPRTAFYDNRNCMTGNIELNRLINKKTYDLEEWSRISIEIKNPKDAYGGEGYTKNIDIIIERSWRFDIDVSFPAGLLTFGTDNTALTGISMAMLAQFSFYEKNRINRFKPYKVGFGFIALDAFNFSDSPEVVERRDVALVVLGSLYPTRKESKLTFPLYFGGGFKLQDQVFFFMVGPGIRVSL
jgi:hypothetical protein